VSAQARIAVAIWLAALLASGYWIARHLTVTTDLGAFLPPAATPVQEVLVDQLRTGVASRLLLVGIDGGDEAALAQASRELARRLDAMAHSARSPTASPSASRGNASGCSSCATR
jgi:predicted exporter